MCCCVSLIRSIDESSKGKRRRSGLPPGVLIERRGSMLFTHFGLSGPAVLDVSRAVTGSAEPRKLVLDGRFPAGMAADEFEQQFRERRGTRRQATGRRYRRGEVAAAARRCVA